MSKKTKLLFPDVKTILAEEMSTEVMKGIGTEIGAHLKAAKDNRIPAQSALVAAMDGLVRSSAEAIRAFVPESNRHEAINEFMRELEKYVNRKDEVKQ